MSSSRTELSALGQSLVDEVFQVTDHEREQLGLGPSEQKQVSTEEYRSLRARITRPPSLISAGGAVINALYTHAILGGESQLISRFGKDKNAEFCQQDLSQHGVRTLPVIDDSDPTGTSLIFVSPDGSRAIVTCLGSAGKVLPGEVVPEAFAAKSFVLIEGYMAGIPGGLPLSLHRALYSRGHALGFILAAPWLATNHRAAVKEFVDMASVVFMNEVESATFTGSATPSQAAELLGTASRLAIVTEGARGVHLSHGPGTTIHVPAFTVSTVDTTGAGDAFAGAFMRGYLQSLPVERAAKAAAYVASIVVSQVGARAPVSVKQGWERVAFE